MNKKIEEIVEQCSTDVGSYDPYGENRIIKFDKEKFAELIVQECAKIAQGDRGGDEYWRARASARADILKHFGIANLEHLGDKV